MPPENQNPPDKLPDQPRVLTAEEVAAEEAAAKAREAASKTEAEERLKKRQAANTSAGNRLYELAQEGYKTAAEVKERAKLIEAHARDLEGSIISAGSVNHTDPVRAAEMLKRAESRFKAGPQK